MSRTITFSKTATDAEAWEAIKARAAEEGYHHHSLRYWSQVWESQVEGVTVYESYFQETAYGEVLHIVLKSDLKKQENDAKQKYLTINND